MKKKKITVTDCYDATPRYYFVFCNKIFEVYSKPNAFHRFMQKILLGIRWGINE